MRNLAFVLAGAIAFTPVRPAAADPSAPSSAPSSTPAPPLAAVAQTLFEEARSDLRRGDFAAAYPKLLQSQQIDPSNGTLLNLVVCEDRLGMATSAWAHATELVARLAADDSRKPIAERELANLSARLAALAPSVGPAAPPPSPVVPAPSSTDAGLAATPPPSPSGIASPASPRWASWAAIGVGAAGLVTGAVLGVLASSRRSQVLSGCPGKECGDASSLAAATEGQRFFVGSVIALGVGAAGTGVGVYLLTRHDSGGRAAPAGAIAGYRGAF